MWNDQRKRTVLIVDDEPVNIAILAEALKNEYRILVATNGPDAIDRALTEPHPDLILLDVIMPSMDGYEVCRRLKNNPRVSSLPVIFVTMLNEAKEEARGFEVGASDYIIKPVNPALVRSRVRFHLENKELHRTFRVLIVDDAPLNIEIVANALSGEKYEIHSETGGLEALKRVRTVSFDLILLDVQMPDLDGFEVLRRLKENPATRDVAVIMLTGQADSESVVNGFELGAQDYLAKPFNEKELLVRVHTQLDLREKNERLKEEKEKSERLLLNILPEKTARDLKKNGRTAVELFENVTVLFSDFVDFTERSTKLTPRILINELNELFTAFDDIMEKNHCERIKTIGDAYLAVCGIPEANPDHARNMVQASLEILEYLERRNASRDPGSAWQIRIGMHTGSAIGGVVGTKKFIYDVFGDAVNTASRVENSCDPMRISVSDDVYQIVKDHFKFEPRPLLGIKGKGPMLLHYVSKA